MHIPLFLSSDDCYAPFVATTLASACDNTKAFIECYVLDGGITEANQDKIRQLEKYYSNFSLEFISVDMDKYFKKIDYSSAQERISISTYNRFLIADLKPEINRALYSDVDVIFLGDIQQFYTESLDGYVLGAVEETHLSSKEIQDRIKRLDLSPDCHYFEAGNLLIDCQKWREQGITQKLFDTTYQYNDRLVLHDMDVLNKVFDQQAKMLPQEYCWMNRKYNAFKEPQGNIVVRHFEGPLKPWHFHPDLKEEKKIYRMRDKDKFWLYAKKTEFYDELIEKVQYKTEAEIRTLLVLTLFEKRKAEIT